MKGNFVQFRDPTPELVNVELQVHTTWSDWRSTNAEQWNRSASIGESMRGRRPHPGGPS
jgi:hypothetical protein